MESSSSPFETLSDEDLCAACTVRPVNEAAWQVFYERFLPFVYRRVRHGLGLNSTEVSDLVQDVFLKVFLKLDHFDPGKSKFKTYISKVVSNLVIDHLRHGSELRARSFSLEAEIGILQLRATQNPEILRLAAERIVDRVGRAAEVPLIRDLLSGTDIKDLCLKYGLSMSAVYKKRSWVEEQLGEVSGEIPEY
jgi:RNA polymerase sigma factor (sigma-70 family)